MPIQLTSKKRIESAALPGVAFTVRRLAHIRRAARDLATLDAENRRVPLVREWRQIMDAEGRDLSTEALIAVRAAELTVEARERLSQITRESNVILNMHIKPAAIRAGLVSVEGITGEDGKPVDDAEKLLANATPLLDGLIEEIYKACEEAGGLDAEEIKNLPLLTTGIEPGTSGDAPTA